MNFRTPRATALPSLALLAALTLAPAARADTLPPGTFEIVSLPAIIGLPGTYVVPQDLTAPDGQPGITVESSEVTIDLGGNVLRGGSGSTIGIDIRSGTAVTVRDGTLTGWSGGAIVGGREAHISGVRILDSTPGINVGDESSVEDCTVDDAQSFGLRVGGNSRVFNCFVGGSSGDGIEVGPTAHVERCVVRSSGGHGLRGSTRLLVRDSHFDLSGEDGIFGLEHSQVHHTTVTRAGAGGIRLAGAQAQVVQCTVGETSDVGISVDRQGLVRECSVLGAQGVGIRLGVAAVARHSSVSDSLGIGILGTFRALVEDCSVEQAQSNGIEVEAGSVLLRNRIYDCLGNGIVVGARNRVEANFVERCSGAGIRVESAGSRIEANQVVECAIALAVDGANNLVIQNSAHGATPTFQIGGDNSTGQMAFNKTWIKLTNPWANFRIAF